MAASNIYELKITLKYSKPPIWRRIQMPASSSFWDLHCAIQDCMEWEDEHLHEFKIGERTIGKVRVGDGEWGPKTLPEESTQIVSCFKSTGDKGYYVYDMGDNWNHTIVLEKILPKVEGEEYPKCVAGKLKGPPEDCGGLECYEYLAEILADPNHEDHEERKEWLEGIGYQYDPKKFDHKEVKFTDPKARWAAYLF